MYTSLITAEDLYRHHTQTDWVIVDCRFSLADTEKGRRDYREGHIPGAFYAHLDEDLSGPVIPGLTGRHPLPEVDDLIALFSSWGIGPGVQVVAYDDLSGAMASRLWWLLRWLGHDAVAVLDGGWPRWRDAGYPVSEELPDSSPRAFVPKIRPELVVDADFVDRTRRDPEYVVVDSRAPERYRGEIEPIDPVAGHIPGAVNIPHMKHVGEDKRLAPPEKLKEHFSGLHRGAAADHTVFYCGSGVTAAHNLLAFYHAGLGEALLYAGSWSEWITDENRAVEKDQGSI